MPNEKQTVYTNELGLIDVSDYKLQSEHSIVVGPTVSEAAYKTDGAADQVQLNAAIDALNALGGGHLILQAGTFTLAGDWVIKSNIKITGAGMATKIVIPNTFKIDINDKSRIIIEDIRIDAKQQLAGGFAIFVKDSQDIIINRIWGEYGSFGVFTTAFSKDVFRIKISNSYFYGPARADLIGGGPNATGSFGTFDIIAENNYLEQDPSAIGFAGVNGTYTNAMDIVAVNRVIFRNNQIKGRIEFGIEQNPNKFSIISGNILKPTGIYEAQIRVSATTPSTFKGQDIIISNNVLENGIIVVTGTVLNKTKNVNITGNTILGGVGLCIILTNTDGILVTGNTLSGFSDAGIELNDANNTNITGNLFKDGSGTAIRDITATKVTNLLISSNLFNAVTVISDVSSSATFIGNKADSQIIKNSNSGYSKLNSDSIWFAKSNLTESPFLNTAGTAPDQQINILPDHNRQVGATSIVTNFGFNSDITEYNFRSKFNGVNRVLMKIDEVNSRVDVTNTDLRIVTAGKGLAIATGANTKIGTATLVAGTVTVANTSITGDSLIFLSRATAGGTTGDLSFTKINGTSFTINSTSATETSTVNWVVIERI